MQPVNYITTTKYRVNVLSVQRRTLWFLQLRLLTIRTIINATRSSLNYTTLYYDALGPLLEQLKTRKQQVSADIWITTVHFRKEEIIQNPVRYLGLELSLRAEMRVTIENIFEDFLKRELLLHHS